MRNGKIEFLRFFAGVSIAVYHFEWFYMEIPTYSSYFKHFYILVEFFFCLSGFFLAANAVKSSQSPTENATYTYVANQVKKLYPLYLVAFGVTFVVTHILSGTPLRLWGGELWKAKWEILLCTIFNFDASASVYNLGGAVGYLGSMLFLSPILHYLILQKRKLYTAVIAPVFIAVGYEHIILTYGNLSQWTIADGWLSAGLIRAASGMSAGALAYLIGTTRLRRPLTGRILKLCGYAAIVSLCLFGESITSGDLILWVFLFAGLLAASYVWPGRQYHIFCYLGKLSYPMFLFHYVFSLLMKTYLPGIPHLQASVLFVVILICASAVILKAYDTARETIKRYGEKEFMKNHR